MTRLAELSEEDLAFLLDRKNSKITKSHIEVALNVFCQYINEVGRKKLSLLDSLSKKPVLQYLVWLVS